MNPQGYQLNDSLPNFGRKGDFGGAPVTCAIETATPVCSVALWVDGRLIEKTETGPGIHSSRLPGLLTEILEEAGIRIREVERWVMSEGPGSFTGLRIGTSFLKGLLFGHSKPLFAVDTLGSLVWKAIQSGSDARRTHAVLDARREHLYHSMPGRRTSIATLKEISEWIQPGDHLIGTGWDRLEDDLKQRGISMGDVRLTGLEAVVASRLIELVNDWEERHHGAFSAPENWVRNVNPDDFSPVYLAEGQGAKP